MNDLRLYFRYVAMTMRVLLQYPHDLWARILSTVVVTFADCLGVFILFGRFGSLGDWQLWEVLTLFGVTSLAFGLSEWLMRGFDSFPWQIRTGTFDRVMLRPRGTILQVTGSRFEVFKITRVLVSAGFIIYGLSHMAPTFMDFLVILYAAASGFLVYTAIFMFFSTISFWTTDSIHLVYIVTNGTLELAQYPMPIYAQAVQRFFTFIVPIACFNYYPMMVVLHRPVEWWYLLAPLMSVPFVCASVIFWRYGVSKYRSVGS